MHTNSVSVIIPFWQGSDSMELESSLKSLLPELSLIGEVILVYDGLSPISVEYFAPTFEKCESDPLMSDLFFKIVHVRSFSNVGPGHARNLGFIYTQFPVIIFLDCGDKNYPGRIHSQLIALRYSDVSYGAIVETSRDFNSRVRLPVQSSDRGKFLLPFINPYNNVTLAIHSKCFRAIGGFPHLRTAEDWLFVAILYASQLNISILPYPLVQVDVGKSFLSRRAGKRVFIDIHTALSAIKRLHILPSFFLSFSIFLQYLFRVSPFRLLLPFIYSFLRSDSSKCHTFR